MLFLPSPLHERCCDIKELLIEINCYIANQATKELNKLRYKLGSGASSDVRDLLIYKEMLLLWAQGDKSLGITLSSLVSRIKHIINK